MYSIPLMKILERKYRGSVICRTIGYPITYAIVKLLLEKGPMELGELTEKVQRAKNTVCSHLTKLRLANIVRYEKKRTRTVYWIKYSSEVRQLIDACERLVKRTARRINRDF